LHVGLLVVVVPWRCMETTGTLAGIFEFKQRVRAAGSDGKFKLQGGEGALEGQDSSQPVVR